MRVRAKTRARGKYNFNPGDELTLDDADGKVLLEARSVELVEDAPKPKRKPRAETATAEPPEETADLPAPRRRRKRADMPES